MQLLVAILGNRQLSRMIYHPHVEDCLEFAPISQDRPSYSMAMEEQSKNPSVMDDYSDNAT